MGPALIAIAVVIGVVTAMKFRQRRLGSFRTPHPIGEGITRVVLVAGPWDGQTVNIDGVPAAGSELSSWTAGLIGDDVHRGHYVVTDVSPAQHTAVGSWQLDQ
jgi:hypothetical protein